MGVKFIAQCTNCPRIYRTKDENSKLFPVCEMNKTSKRKNKNKLQNELKYWKQQSELLYKGLMLIKLTRGDHKTYNILDIANNYLDKYEKNENIYFDKNNRQYMDGE